MQYQISINAKKLTSGLTWAAAALLLVHGALSAWNYLVARVPWYLRDFFDVDMEENLPTWFSGFILLVATTFLWILMREKAAKGDPMAGRWKLLFVGFCFLSIDEIAGFHETVNTLITPSWAWGGAAISLGLLIYFRSFLQSLPMKIAVGFLVAGALYVGGAVGMEFVGEPIPADTLLYKMTTLVEEGGEMFGVILFIRTLLNYMESPALVIGVKRK